MSPEILAVREPWAAYAAEQARVRGFASTTAFIEHLIEADRRGSVRACIEEALAEGLASAPIEMTTDWWSDKRAMIAAITPESAS